MSRFVPHAPASAPERSRPLMAAVARQQGFLPDAVARIAESPHVLATLLQQFKAFEATGLSPLEREVVALAVARRNGCHLCIALHSALLTSRGTDARVLEALRTGGPLGDARLDALARFTEEVLTHAGAVPDAAWEGFLAAGFTRERALEVVLGVAAYTLSTLANRLVGAQVDAPLRAFAPAA